MDAKVPMMLEGNDKPGFKIDLHIKDLNNAVETGHELGMALPMTVQVLEMFEQLHGDGLGQKDHSALIRYYAKDYRSVCPKVRNPAAGCGASDLQHSRATGNLTLAAGLHFDFGRCEPYATGTQHRQMDMQACPLDSLLAGINSGSEKRRGGE